MKKKTILPDKAPDDETVSCNSSNGSEHHDNPNGNMIGGGNLFKAVPIGMQKR